MATISTVNPATGMPVREYPAHGWTDIDERLSQARAAGAAWAAAPLARRAELLRRVGALLTERRAEYAALMTGEMGKPVTEALAEVDKCAWNCAVVAGHAASWLGERPASTPPHRSWVCYEPLGIVLAIMPWNFPFWQVIRFAAAALVAGNAAVVKHAPSVTGCALAIERLFADAGCADGLLSALLIAEEEVGTLIPQAIADPRIAAVTLTGSERAGIAVAGAAGTALKKSVLELGGSDPFVVLADADLPAAVAAAVRSRFGNGGQSCVSAKRFIVDDSVADDFVALLAERVAELPVGDPTLSETRVGPMARADLRDAVHRQVLDSVAQGAQLVAGGVPAAGGGFYYPPTVLDRVTPGMAVFTEETFGPVAAVVRARDDEHCVELANDTDFGLGAAVWGTPGRALRVGRHIRSGALFVNAIVASDPRLPFGGVGRSGYGRELAAEGVREFTNVRTVVVASAPGDVFGNDAEAPAFDHIGLNVHDLPAMTRWYAAALALTVEFEFALDHVEFRGVMLRSPTGFRLELLCRAGSSAGLQPTDPVDAALTRGYGHVALDVSDVDASHARLLAAGATDRMSPRPSPEPGVRMAYVADPEGNLVELLDRTTAKAARA